VVASQFFFSRASTPPLLRRGLLSSLLQLLHNFYDRAYKEDRTSRSAAAVPFFEHSRKF